MDVFDRFTGGVKVTRLVLIRALFFALSLAAVGPLLEIPSAAAQGDSSDSTTGTQAADDAATPGEESSDDGLRYRLELLQAERDALARGNPTYAVVDHARPCLILRAAPNGEEVDCLDPGEQLTLLGVEGSWSRVSQGEGIGAWVKSEYLEPAPAASGSRARMAADLAAAREANLDLRERLETAEASLQSAWEAQMTLSARLLEAQASGEGATGDRDALAESVDRLTFETERLAAETEALDRQRRDLETALARADELRETTSRRLEQTTEALASAEITYVVGAAAQPCVNARPAPDSENRIDCLPPGTRLVLVELDDPWVRVRLPEGVEAWVTRQFLQPDSREKDELRHLTAARAQLDEMRTATRVQHQRLEEAQGAHATLQAKLLAAEAETERLRTQIPSSTAQGARIAELKEEVDTWRAAATAADSQSAQLSDQVTQLTARVEAAESQIQSATSSATDQITALQIERDSLRMRAVAAEGQAEDLTGLRPELDSWRERAVAAEAQAEDLAGLRAELDSWRERATVAETRGTEQSERADGLEVRVAQLSEGLEQANRATEQRDIVASQELTELQVGLDSWRARAAAAETRASEQSERAEGFEAQVAELTAQVEEATRAVDERDTSESRRLLELQTALDSWREKATAAETRAADQSERADGSEARVAELQAQVEEARSAAERRDAIAGENLAELQTELDSWREKATAADQRGSAAALRLNDLQAELDSWRVKATAAEARGTELSEQAAGLSKSVTELTARVEAADNAARELDSSASLRRDELQAEIDSWRQKAFLSEQQTEEQSQRIEQLTRDLATATEGTSAEIAAGAERATALQAEIEAGAEREARLRSQIDIAATETAAAATQLEQARNALALGGSTWVVTTGANPCLNLRAAPGDGAPIDCLKPGTRLTLLELRPSWGRSRLPNGSEGWTSLEFIEPSPATPAELEALGTAQAELTASRRTTRSLESDLEQVRAQLGDAKQTELELRSLLDQTNSQTGDELAQLSSRLAGAESALDDANQEKDALASQLLTATAEADRLRTEASTASAALDQLEAQLASSNEARDLLHGELASRRAALQRRESELEAATGDRDSLEAQLTSHRDRLTQLESELASATESQEVRASEVEELASQLAAERRELEAARDANDELEQRLAQANQTVDDLAQARATTEDLEARLLESERARQRLAEAAASTDLQDNLARAQETILERPAPIEVAQEPVAVSEPEAAAADPVELSRLVDEWARAWSDQRVDDYLGFYASTFEPANGSTRADWAAQRGGRITTPSFVEVKLSEIETSRDDPVSVTFVQAYRSSTFSDRVRKVLSFVHEDGAWKIATEVSAPVE